MKIDFLATKANMKILKIGAWARAHGFEEPTVRRILAGNYPYPDGETFKAVVAVLRSEGYLVEVPDSQAAA